MKVNSQSIGPCRLELKIQADGEETRETYASVQQKVLQQGRIPGFRPGKAPMEIVMRHYGPAIEAETQDVLIRKYYRDAIKDTGVEPVAILDIADVVFVPQTGIRFTVRLDVPPEFKLPKYKGLSVSDETAAVGEEQVAERIGQLQSYASRYEVADNQPIAEGDVARVSYQATLDGQPLAEAVPEAASLATAENAWVQATEAGDVPGLGMALVGVQSGDSKTVTLTFPKTFAVEALRDKTVDYALTVGEVRQRLLPDLDETFCQRFGFTDEAALREGVKTELQNEAQRVESARRRDQVGQLLLRKTKFDLPESVVNEEARLTLQQILNDIVQRGVDQDALKENRDALVQTARETAEERVRLNYILLRIAQAESITVRDDEIDQRIHFMAANYRMTDRKLREQLEKRNGTERLVSEIRAQKTMNWLLEQAKVG